VTSSETSTMATRSPEVGASTGDADVAAADAVVATVATTTPCSGPMATVEPRGGLPVAAVLTAARGALDERRLVGTAASDLSTLACARAGTVGVTPRTRNTGVSVDPSKSRTHGGSATQLKLEKPCFLFLKGSGGASVAPAGSAMAPAGTSATLVGYSTDDPAAGASTPAAGTSTPAAGASSTSASAARGDGCGGFHLLGGARPTSLTSSFSSDDDEFACVVGGGGSPYCSRSRYSSSCCSRCSCRLILLSFVRRPLLFPSLRGAGGHSGPGCWWIRPCGVHWYPLLKITIKDRAGTLQQAED
jgi:hypothetical protein